MFKKENSKNIINIDSIDVRNTKCYEVKYITRYDRNIFGFMKHVEKIKTVPFYFKSLEIAKDFCELSPKYNKIIFSNGSKIAVIGEVKYHTYKIKLDDKEFYIEWEYDSIIREKSIFLLEFKIKNKPIVENFVSDIILKNWLNSNEIYDVNFKNRYELLSELINELYKNYNEHYSFELVSRI